MSILIEFQGKRYWLMANSFEESAPIAPLEHVDSEGDIRDWSVAIAGESFAHWYPGTGIIQYGELIGTREDISVIRTVVNEY